MFYVPAGVWCMSSQFIASLFHWLPLQFCLFHETVGVNVRNTTAHQLSAKKWLKKKIKKIAPFCEKKNKFHCWHTRWHLTILFCCSCHPWVVAGKIRDIRCCCARYTLHERQNKHYRAANGMKAAPLSSRRWRCCLCCSACIVLPTGVTRISTVTPGMHWMCLLEVKCIYAQFNYNSIL